MKTNVLPQLAVLDFDNFDLKTLVVDSDALKRNPLGDSSVRRSPVLVPREGRAHPVVFMLSGFSGNGDQTFNVKSFETGSPLKLDAAVSKGDAPRAVYVFVDAMTMWGGSQFINSAGMGRYESYLLEVADAVSTSFDVSQESRDWCAMGGSSGGYGAIHLATQFPKRFGVAVALAPDCFFESNILSEIRAALPIIKRMGGVAGVRAELREGRLLKRKDWHVVLNAIAMGLCYAGTESGEIRWPIDPESGLVHDEIWQEWKTRDPLFFLQTRDVSAQFYLDAGDRDQFQLQYGTRQMRDLLKKRGANVEYVGFDGTHFDLSERRGPAWAWLASLWRT